MAGMSFVPIRAWRHVACVFAALALFPTIGHARDWFYHDNMIAYTLYHDGQYKRSLAHWDRTSNGSFGRGVALMHLGRMYDAEQAFRLCLHLMPQVNVLGAIGGPVVHKGFLASIWYNLGNTLYAQHKLKQAAAAWRKALDYQPGHTKARHNLEVVNRLLGKSVESEDNPLGLGGKHQPAGPGKGQGSGSGKGSKPKQPSGKQGGGKHQGGGKQQAKSGERHRQGTGKDKQQGGQGRGSHAPNGQQKNQTGKGRGAPAKDISVLQTENELRMVQEGVNVFMRHRLNEKHGRVGPPYRGPAW